MTLPNKISVKLRNKGIMLRKSKPNTPGKRHRVVVDRTKLHKGNPEKSLLAKGHKKRQGRGFKGKITMRHRGGGVKKRMRIIDFKRRKLDVPGIVKTIEYDPMRSANIALIFYKDGEKRYILAPEGLKIGDTIVASEKADPRVGNAMPLDGIWTMSRVFQEGHTQLKELVSNQNMN